MQRRNFLIGRWRKFIVHMNLRVTISKIYASDHYQSSNLRLSKFNSICKLFWHYLPICIHFRLMRIKHLSIITLRQWCEWGFSSWPKYRVLNGLWHPLYFTTVNLGNHYLLPNDLWFIPFGNLVGSQPLRLQTLSRWAGFLSGFCFLAGWHKDKFSGV